MDGQLQNLVKNSKKITTLSSKNALNESSFEFWNKKWGYRNLKYIESKSEQLHLKFAQKVNCILMQLEIMATIIQSKIEVRQKIKKDDIENKRKERQSSSEQKQLKEEEDRDKQRQFQFPDDFDQLRQRSQVQSKFSSSQESTFQSRSVGSSMFQSHNKIQSQISYQTCKIQLLRSHIEEVQYRLGQQLLQSQTKIQKQCQSKQILRSYETRIKDMLYNLAGKQNSISIEHTERQQEKIKGRAVKNFNDYYLELMNIRSMCKKLKESREQIKKFEDKNFIVSKSIQNQKVVENQLYQRQNLAEKLQKQIHLIKRRQTICRKFEKENIQKVKAINDQRVCVFKDPFFVKILEMLKCQTRKEKSLMNKYKQLKNNFRTLCINHKDLIHQLSLNKKRVGTLLQYLPSQ